jgi:hypothetical protein
MERERAREGDEVEVFFTGQIDSGPIRGTISYVPQSTGDSWVIVEPDGGIVHVQLFDFIRVTSRKANALNEPRGNKA